MSYERDPSGQLWKIGVTIDANGIPRLNILGVAQAGAQVVGPAQARGLEPGAIIEIAQKRTERRGKTLDMPSELVIVAQEFCAERRWYWRKKSITFSTEAGISTYDVSAQDGMYGLTCERVCREGPKLFTSSNQYNPISAVFETDAQEQAREDTTQGVPGQYFMDGQDQMRLVPTPRDVYRVRVPLWALPDSSPIQAVVPLVPPHLQHILVKGLEAKIFRFTMGEGSTKYLASKAEYDAAVLKAAGNVDFADGRRREWVSDEVAIRSS